MQLKRKLLALFLTCTALFLLTAAPAFAAETSRDSITVTGSAEEEVAPDMATIYGSLEQKSPTAAEAREGLARQIQALKRELRLQLLSDADVQNIRYSLEPQYIVERNSNRRKPDGYLAFTQYKIRVTNLQKLGPVLDKSISSGLNVSHVEFGLKDRNLYENKLLDQAVTSARARAAVVARAGGRQLGTLLNASLNTATAPIRLERSYLMAAKAQNDVAPVGTELSAGVLTVSARVNLVFGLQ